MFDRDKAARRRRGRCGGLPPQRGVPEDREAGWRQGGDFPPSILSNSRYGCLDEISYDFFHLRLIFFVLPYYILNTAIL
jgi:hypothetical protein